MDHKKSLSTHIMKVPTRIAKRVDPEKAYIKYHMKKNGTFEAFQCTEFGEVVDKTPSEYESKILQTQKNIKSRVMETNLLIEKKFGELSKRLSEIEKKQVSVAPAESISTSSYSYEEEEEEDEIELIDIKPKDEDDYKYVLRFIGQDQEQYKEISELLEEENPELDQEEYIELSGLKIVKGLGGYPSVLLDFECDWETDFKGRSDILLQTYFSPRLYTYIKDEDGIEQRVSYEEIEPFLEEALFQFISPIVGKTYNLDCSEVWFDPYDPYTADKTVEDMLSKKVYKEYLDGETDNRMSRAR